MYVHWAEQLYAGGWGDADSVRAAGVGEEAITLSVECAMERPTTGGHLVASAAATVRVHTAKMRPKRRISSSNRPSYGNHCQSDQLKHNHVSQNSASHAEGRWFDPSRDHKQCGSGIH
jgi:hypothetical protein